MLSGIWLFLLMEIRCGTQVFHNICMQMSSCCFLCPWIQHWYNYLMYIIFVSKALVHNSENFQPPWKWLLEYFISRLSFRPCVDIHVSSYQSFIHKTLCSAEQLPDNVGNQKESIHSNIWSVVFKSHLLIIFWDLSKNFISFLAVSSYYFLKNIPKCNEMKPWYFTGNRHSG